MSDETLDIFDFTVNQINDALTPLNEKKFRSKQVYEWLHSHVITTYDDMHNIPKKVRNYLSEKYPFQTLSVKVIQESSDGTKKFLFECEDGNLVESVLIPNDDGRLTACLSTQVGCPMQCIFCATGKQGFKRNLTSQEICFQVSHLLKHSDKRIDNIVIMGQGEPFINYDNILSAIKRFNHDEAFKIASRKITVSTCGILEGIKKFSHESEQFGLAVSLHSADQATRNVLMPKTKNMPLESLSEALKEYQQISNRRITFEYMLLDGINDSEVQCEKLIDFCKPLLCHVNLLKFNDVEDCNYKGSSYSKIKQFENNLINSGIPCSVRKSKGDDIQGACGQLANSI
jgi:23S rRNA (adenine2503-C2)-methyltransferase